MRCVREVLDRPALLLGLGLVLAVAAFHLWITPSNPPGYHRDEAASDASGHSRTARYLAAALVIVPSLQFVLFVNHYATKGPLRTG